MKCFRCNKEVKDRDMKSIRIWKEYFKVCNECCEDIRNYVFSEPKLKFGDEDENIIVK